MNFRKIAKGSLALLSAGLILTTSTAAIPAKSSISASAASYTPSFYMHGRTYYEHEEIPCLAFSGRPGRIVQDGSHGYAYHANVLDEPGYLAYNCDVYVISPETNNYVAEFSLKEDLGTRYGSNCRVAQIEIYNRKRDKIIAHQEIKRHDLEDYRGNCNYTKCRLEFSTAGYNWKDGYEIRVYYFATAALWFDKVSIYSDLTPEEYEAAYRKYGRSW